MKRTSFAALLWALVMLSACAQNVELIKSLSATTRDNVFLELPEKAAIPAGKQKGSDYRAPFACSFS